MNVKKKFRDFIAMLACLTLVLGNVMVTQAAGESGISGNGTSGIYIDINSYPYTYYSTVPTWGQWAYTTSGCAWFATSRATQITGKQFSTIYSGSNWYNNAYATYGFSRGSTIRDKSLACYENHIAVVEGIEGNQAVISEGGYTSTDSAHGYTVIRKRNLSDMGSAGEGGRLLGYVYLTNAPITVSLSWSGERCEYDTANAFFYAKANANVSGSYTQTGFTLWDEAGNVVASKSENPAYTGSSLEIWYNVTDETGVVLKAGTNYKYQIYTTFNGTQYKTDVKSFRTNGQAANSWTKALSIDDWTYGETAKTPVATPKYGTVSFTYSTTENGTYTAEVPKTAGTYYVKASVPPTDQYTALTATKEFHIKKANPQYVIPNDISMTYGQSLDEVELPEGFTWKDPDVVANQLGSCQFDATFTPEDIQNYQEVNVKIDVTVNPKMETLNEAPVIIATDKTITVGDTFNPQTGITASDKEDGDITANLEVLKNEVDTTNAGVYEVTYKVTDSQGASYTKTVKVTVKERKVSTSNTNKEKNPDKSSDKTNKTGNPKTGDQTNAGLFTSLLVISTLVIAILAVFKKKKTLEYK